MSAATGDWPGRPPVKVAKQPEQQGLERDNRAGPHGITEEDLGCLPRAAEGEAEDRHITLTYRGDRVARVSRESLSVGMGVLNRNRDLM